jgi:predicted dehydrogenase
MRILVVGAGSIGTRHINNLKALGHEVYAVDLNPENLKKVTGSIQKGFVSLKDGLKTRPQAAFICSFSNSHIKPALECAEAGCHLFIEKPLSTDMQGIEKLVKIVKAKKLVSMVGCNMRFHPAIAFLQNLVAKKAEFKKILSAELEFGYYLPFAKKDYAQSYMAKRKLGGNIIFDCIHELDYAVWFFGQPKKVFCSAGKVSKLKIDTQDLAQMFIEFESGAMVLIHLDYLQHGYSRSCKIISDEAVALWDFTKGNVGLISRKSKKWRWIDKKAELYFNRMFIDEIKYFLKSVNSGSQTFNSIEDAIPVLKLAMAANRSAASGKWEAIKGGLG